MLKILVVDDNRSSADAMSRILKKQGHDVVSVYDGATAISLLQDGDFKLVFTDLKMEPVDGLQVLRAARALATPVEVIVFTAFGAVEHAVEAMQLGARDFLTKPVSVDQILDRVRQISGDELPGVDGGPIVAESAVARALLTTLEAVADVPSPVWIEGEIGSGRLQAAARLHAFAGDDRPYTVVDPADPRPWPDEGTIVLPAVDDLSDADQHAVARRLKTVPAGVRIIATARPGGRRRVADGELRGDLYFALAVVIVEMPPLRDRIEDIVPLFRQALAQFCEKYGRPVPELPPGQLERLQHHSWPGNVRELLNLAERTAVLGAKGFELDPVAPTRPGMPILEPGFRLAAYLEQIERDILEEALRQADGDRNAAGRLLGVERNTLRYKLNKYDLLD
ncbi:MAG: sigma-54-dependent Fis family transcriptional regulator [Alphaproteobacteria bacterium]|nr:sigma-54-dependent Fis family transcriptional regulator [Alphaproteobacteria bacterium]